MRIGFNLLYLLPGIVGGTQTYAVSLIRAMVTMAPENDYILFRNEESADLDVCSHMSVTNVICPIRAKNRAARYLWEQTGLPSAAMRQQLDVLHSLGDVGPLRTPCPHVVTIHDMNYVALHDSMSLARRIALAKMVPAVARNCNQVITISEFSRLEISRHIPIPESKIIVIFEAPRELSSATGNDQAAVLERFGIVRPYLLTFGSLSPHKNLVRLLRSFAEVCREQPHQLVVVGHLPEARQPSDFQNEIVRLKLDKRVVITGYVSDFDISPLLSGAELFVFPSVYEGFGLPVLEAQSSSVAVACSKAASIPEIAGEGAVYFDPYSEAEIAATLRRCLDDPALRKELIERGHRNAARFSWQKAARQTLEVYSRLLSATSAG